MAKEIIETRFFLGNSRVASGEALRAYGEAKEWAGKIPTTQEAYAGARLFPGEHDGSQGSFVQKVIWRKEI